VAAITAQFVSGLTRGVGIGGAIWRHPANQRRRLRALLGFLAWQFVKRVLKRPVVISYHDKRLKCYPDSTSTSGALYFGGYPDYREMKFLQAYLRRGDNVLDIGANAGVYTIFACAYIGAEGSVDAFEPIQRIATRVEEQAALNGLQNVRVHQFAVSNEDGETRFDLSNNDAMGHLQKPGEAASNSTAVKTIKLDSFEPFLQYAVGKMDIEGAEPLALAGAGRRLANGNPPVWLLELAGYSIHYGFTSDQVIKQLADAGFDCAVYEPETGRLQFTSTPWVFGVQNVLAISNKHRLAVEQRLRESWELGR
jgi:FkbM family methyltransferase